ncbi:MAG: DUF4625 domain-containing protein [Dysgonamonadaceae bacterium]|jgi:hypothetical protein|nr:DUF4625 domain-containing protein [Dysgonamonadaceae bacterium]
MKLKIVFFICLMAIFSIVLNSCKEDSDTTKPVINLIEPAEGDALQIGGENGVHFEVEFSDNEMLASYKVNIHSNFDGHTHARASGASVDYEFEKSWSISGKNADIYHHEITIPENATPGDYHLMVYCTDAAGNESHIAVNVALSH